MGGGRIAVDYSIYRLGSRSIVTTEIVHMKSRKRILSDHKKRGKVLIPPFTHMLGPMYETSWVRTIFPELLWIALIHNLYGDQKAVELITLLTRSARRIAGETHCNWFAAISHYTVLDAAKFELLQEELNNQKILVPIQNALIPLVSWYPKCPLAVLLKKRNLRASRADLENLKVIVDGLYNRPSRTSVMVQATAMWLAFDADILKVGPDISLARFPEIEHYPATDISRQIGAAIRASLNAFFGSQIHYSSSYSWPDYFWNRGLAIQPCERHNG